jgi:hypothetical protein
MVPKPQDWDWCTEALWRAYQQEKPYQGLPAKYLGLLLHCCPSRELFCTRLSDGDPATVIKKLLKINADPSVRADVIDVIIIVGPEPALLNRDIKVEQAVCDKVAKLSRSLIYEINNDSTMSALEYRYGFSAIESDKPVNLDLDIELKKQLLAPLDRLARIAELPAPPNLDEDMVSKKCLASTYITRERHLKKLMTSLTGKPRHQLVADIINWLYPEADRSYDNVRKS